MHQAHMDWSKTEIDRNSIRLDAYLFLWFENVKIFSFFWKIMMELFPN